MRIGIDARAAAEVRGGRGRYIRELIRHLPATLGDHEVELLARRPWTDSPRDDRLRWVRVAGNGAVWPLRVAGVSRRRGHDVLLSANSYLTTCTALVPSVLVVFDLVTFESPSVARWQSVLVERATLEFAARRASAIAAISHATRGDLVARVPGVAERTAVTPLAADPGFHPGDGRAAPVAPRYGLDRRFVLVPGTVEPRKNLPRLIDAFAQLPEDLRRAFALVLVGDDGWEMGATEAALGRAGGLAMRLGYVPDDDLRALYREATLVAYPSLHEGFGLPILEAMRSAVPVISSSVSSMPEIGGDAVRYIDPCDVDDIRVALADVLADESERERMSRLGLERAKKFDWKRTAAETVRLLERAAAA